MFFKNLTTVFHVEQKQKHATQIMRRIKQDYAKGTLNLEAFNKLYGIK